MSGTSSLWSRVAQDIAPSMPPAVTAQSPIQQRRRRGFSPATDDGRETLELVRDDGILRWAYRPPAQVVAGGRRAWRSIGVDSREVVQRFEYPPLGRNQITSALASLDHKLNGARGLRRWRNGAWQSVSRDELAALQGRVLLLVHGTFSRNEMYDSELGATASGTTLFDRLASAGQPYSALLAFDHATLSVPPWLNAVDLIDSLAPLKARVDAVCHSRGGLVLCWALKVSPLLVDRVVFVGSPLIGTSLAAPDRLRGALDLLANVADAIGNVATGVAVAFPPAVPLATGAAGLAKVLGKTLNLGASLPIGDALVGLVPGLMSQSKVGNNLEIERLFPLPTAAKLYSIGVTFEPDEIREPAWKFWSRFSNIVDQAKYLGADLIFRQPNDLVVDTASMNQLGQSGPILTPDWNDLGKSPVTHHCSYFRDQRVIAFLDQKLR